MKLYIAENKSDIEDIILDLIDEVTAKKMVVGVDPLVCTEVIDYLKDDERVTGLFSLSNEKESLMSPSSETMFKDFDLMILNLKENGAILYNKGNSSFGNVMVMSGDKISVGLKKISGAKRVIAIAKDLNMAQTVYDLVNGSKTEAFPASILMDMDNAILICDKEAASLI